MKIDLGCGSNKKQGFKGVDMDPKSQADYIVDIEKKRLPFKDNSVDEVYSYHFFEHIKDLTHVLKEVCRVCRDGAIVNIHVPHYKSKGAFAPVHERFFTEETFDWFDMSNECRWKHSTPPEGINLKVLKVRVIRGRIRFWKPYGLHYTLKVVKK